MEIILKRSFLVTVLISLTLFATSLMAAVPSVITTVNWGHLILGLFAGLALFLFGMEQMSTALNKSAGNKMRSILSLLTKHPLLALAVGIFVTVIIQSSSATTVMLVSFVQSGLMPFSKTLGVVLGASIGTTVTAQLVAFKITYLAYFMVALGFGMTFFAKKSDFIKYIGEAILGFGILFIGMKLMSTSMSPLRTYPEFINLIKELENPILGILFAALFTAIIQSSSAFLGIIIVLAKQNLIDLEAGVPLVIGTNIGTCITALLASIGASRDATRVGLVHILFKIIGALIFVGWIHEFAEFIGMISDKAGTVEPARRIANAHTVYNVGLAIFFFPFLKYFEKIVMFIIPEKKMHSDLPVLEVKHLDDSLLNSPSLAIDVARAEVSRMAQNIRNMLASTVIPLVSDDYHNDDEYPSLTLVDGILFREKKINFIEKEVKRYLIKVFQRGLSDDQAQEAYALINVAQDLESIADVVSKGIVPQISKKRASEVNFSIEGLEELTIYHSKACKQLARLHGALRILDPEKAQRVISKMEGYLHLESDYKMLHLERLRESRTETVATHDMHTALMDCFKRINVHTGDIARTLTNIGQVIDSELS